MPGRGWIGGGGRGTLAQLDPLALLGLEPALVFFFFPPFPPTKGCDALKRHWLDCKRESIKNYYYTSGIAFEISVAAFVIWQMCILKKHKLIQTCYWDSESIWTTFQHTLGKSYTVSSTGFQWAPACQCLHRKAQGYQMKSMLPLINWLKSLKSP